MKGMHLNLTTFGFFHNSKRMPPQFAPVAQLFQMAQLAQLDKFFLATDRDFVA